MIKHCELCGDVEHPRLPCDVYRKRQYQESKRRLPMFHQILAWWFWYKQCKSVEDYVLASETFFIQGPIAINLILIENCIGYREKYKHD